VLQWTRDWPRAQALAYRVACIFAEEVAQVTEPWPLGFAVPQHSRRLLPSFTNQLHRYPFMY